MSVLVRQQLPAEADGRRDRRFAVALVTATVAFFMITLDAVIVNVALPSIRDDLGGGIAGLQWVVDGYTLLFAGLLLSSGVLSDRVGAKRALGFGMAAFLAASMWCALASSIQVLVVARFVQGGAAAVMMPSSMALISQAYRDRVRRVRAVALWAMGGAIASTSGPVLGGVLTMVSWRLIFAINVPVGLAALWLLRRVERSPVRDARFDWAGMVLAVVAMRAVTFAAIEAGAVGVTDARVMIAAAVAVVASVGFVNSQRRSRSPMVPSDLVRNRDVVITSVVGFAFIVGYYGLPFVMSLFLQEQRGLSSVETGLVFLPMMLIGAILTPISARVAERVGQRRLITAGLVVMTAGLAGAGVASASAPIWVWSALMFVVGLSGPAIMPPTMGRLLSGVPDHQAGTASGIFNTTRQLGGALAVAVFGALLNHHDFADGMQTSLLIAAVVAAVAAAASRRLDLPAAMPHRAAAVTRRT
jgi:EmrB/QacA subfamily drug resistance transporter